MTTWVQALLILTAIPASATSPVFTVELFSQHRIKALVLESTRSEAEICGAKTPCWKVPPGKRAFCIAGNPIHCLLAKEDRTFALLRLNSPVRVTPTFAGGKEEAQGFLLPNMRVTSTRESLRVTTRLDLEAYVSGVLRGEASVLKAPAARQAMAILARTWALRWQGRHAAQGFDFCSLTHCQVFHPPQDPGGTREAAGIDEAARATRGKVLQYRGELADPYFTASCGGMTEAAGNVWPDRAQPYLISIHDPYCQAGSHASWEKALRAESVQQVLRDAFRLPVAGPLTGLVVEKRDSSGRALLLRATSGAAWDIDANQFRYALDRRLGWGQIMSNLYTLQFKGNTCVFNGHGFGHGVGLCQAGAEQMARMGASTERILITYFPGTEIASAANYRDLKALEDVDEETGNTATPGGVPPGTGKIAWATRARAPDPIAASEHFELAYPVSQEPWVREALDALEQWRTHLGEHATTLPPRVRVTTWDSVAEFIRATGEPGWMAAASDGQSISLQPLELLARKRILVQTVRHELTHLVVHRLRAPDVPRWFEEGCVLYFTGERIETPPSATMSATALEQAVSRPRSEAEMKTAYAQALERVRQRAQHQGEAVLWQTLAHPHGHDLHAGAN